MSKPIEGASDVWMEAHCTAWLTHLCILRCAGTREVFLDLNQVGLWAASLHRGNWNSIVCCQAWSLSLPGKRPRGLRLPAQKRGCLHQVWVARQHLWETSLRNSRGKAPVYHAALPCPSLPWFVTLIGNEGLRALCLSLFSSLVLYAVLSRSVVSDSLRPHGL